MGFPIKSAVFLLWQQDDEEKRDRKNRRMRFRDALRA